MNRFIFCFVFLVSSPLLAMDFGVHVRQASTLISFGDSMTAGNAASDAAHRYTNRLSELIGGSLNNQGVSGTGMAQQSRSALSLVSVRNASVLSVMAGFNDLLRTGSSSFPKIQTNLRAFIANGLLREAVPASGMRQSGVWTSAGSSDGGKAITLGGTGLYTTSSSAYLEWDFFGETLVVGSWTTTSAANGGTYRDFSILIDGSPVGTFFANGATDDAYPATNFNASVFLNLGFTKHTVRLVPLSSGPYTIVDYVGTLAEPGSIAPILVAQIPSMTNWTYNGNTLSPQTLADANALIASVTAEFPGWVRLVPTNDFYTPGTCCTASDGQHPNDTGMAEIGSAFWSQISLFGQ